MFGKEKITKETPEKEISVSLKEQSIKEKTMKAFNGNVSNVTTLIAKGTEIIGDIKFSGDLQVEGKVCGNIIATSEGDAIARVLEDGHVEGNLKVPTIIINGTVKGDVHSASHIELAAKAQVEGNVHYNLIEMVKGAQINGNLVYNGREASRKVTNMSSGAKKSPDSDIVSAK